MSINHQHEIPRPEPSARETWGLKGNEAEGIRSEVDWARGAGSLSMQLLLPAARPVAFAIPFGVSQLPDTAIAAHSASQLSAQTGRRGLLVAAAPWMPAGHRSWRKSPKKKIRRDDSLVGMVYWQPTRWLLSA